MANLSAIATALMLALSADPGLPPDALDHDIIQALKKLKARPYDELTPDLRRSVDGALRIKECGTATELLIERFMKDYPHTARLRGAEDFDRLWWIVVGQEVYPDGFVCFMESRLEEYARQYKRGYGNYAWCGDIDAQEPDPFNGPVEYEIDVALDYIGLTADEGRPEAVRALLEAHKEYEFVELDDIARYALLARLADHTELTAGEQKLKDELAARLPQETRQDIEWGLGYLFAMRKYGTCGSSVR